MANQCRTFPGGANTDSISTAVTMSGGTLRSLVFWLNLNAPTTTSRLVANQNLLMEILYSSTNNFTVVFGWSGAFATWDCPLPSTGVWTSVVITYDGSSVNNNPLMYLQGVSQTVTRTVAPSGSLNSTAAAIDLGHSTADAGQSCLDGSLFGFAYWNNTILSADNALAHANGIAPCALNVTPTLYLPMDRGESPEPDLGSTGTTGTVTGTTVGVGPPNLKARCRVFVPTNPLIGTAVGGPFFANPLG